MCVCGNDFINVELYLISDFARNKINIVGKSVRYTYYKSLRCFVFALMCVRAGGGGEIGHKYD